MTGTVDSVEELANALSQTRVVLDNISPDQLDSPTPCASWDVRALIEHVMNDLEQFTAMSRGQTPDADTPPPDISNGWMDAYDERSRALLDAWRHNDHPQGGVGLQVSEFALHSWDLARATGQHITLDPTLAEVGNAWMRSMMKPEYRGSEADGKMFGPEVEVPDDAPAYERLAAFSGRTP